MADTVISKAACEWVEDNGMMSGESSGIQEMLQFRGWSWMGAKAAAQLFTGSLKVADGGEGAFTINLTMGPRNMTFEGNGLKGEASEKVEIDEEEKKKMEEAGGGSIGNLADNVIESCELKDGTLVLHGYELEEGKKIVRKITMEPRADDKLNWTVELTRGEPAEGQEKELCLKLVFIKA